MTSTAHILTTRVAISLKQKEPGVSFHKHFNAKIEAEGCTKHCMH